MSLGDAVLLVRNILGEHFRFPPVKIERMLALLPLLSHRKIIRLKCVKTAHVLLSERG